MMLGEVSSDISTLTSQMGAQIFLAAISLHKPMFSHSPKRVFSLLPQTPTPPLLILSLRVWLRLILDWGNRSNQIGPSSSLPSAHLWGFLPLYSYSLPLSCCLPRVECPYSYPKLTNLPLVLGSPSLAFSRMLLQFPRSLLHHGCLALFWIIPTCIQTISGISWPHIPSQLLLPFSLLWHSTHSWAVYGIQFPTSLSPPAETGLCPALSPLISMLPSLMVKLLLLSHLIAQQHLIW